MRVRPLSTLFLAAVAAVMATNCGSDSTVAPREATPAPTAPSQSLLGGLLGGTTTLQTVTPLNRTTPLAQPITVSKTIGVLGGAITVPGAGLTVVVPPLAVGKNTLFSITALAGSAVAYDFQPHGTKFLVPLVATQDLHNTQGANLLNLSLFAGYFPDSSNPTQVSQTFSVQVSLLTLTAVWTIPHFSGYIVATGRDDSSF